MNIDLGSLFFNASIETGGGTPSWGTALGQSSPEYKLTCPGAPDILVAMDYCYTPLSNEVTCKLGKGGKEYKAIESQQGNSKYEIIKAALFENVQVKIGNDLLPIDKPFALLVTKENENTHKGRRTLKYSDSACIGGFCNKDFFDAVQEKLGGPTVCWFAYAIDALEQNKLVVSIVKVSDDAKTYQTAEMRKKEWLSLVPPGYSVCVEEDDEITPEQLKNEFGAWLNNPQNCRSEDDAFKRHLVDVIEKWLDGKIPNNGIGNLFRFSDPGEYETEKTRIFSLPLFKQVSSTDQSGRPMTALNHYGRFLCSRSNKYSFVPKQIIYYGVPGCGKSHQIQEDLKKKNITEDNHQVKRVVFHPDYCNADFVGQILPVTKKDGGIRYQFKAGPFTKILRDAYANPDKEYALIIEEINRGNAAAIFGDLFQLLDRKRESDPVEVVNGNSYGPGWSDYCVENDYINAYFRGAYEGDETPNPLPPKTLGKITFNDNVDIRLPPNLSLYATMNTSDQNVFTLDNAFQRRWEMKQISNDLKNDEAHSDEKAQYDQLIGNTGVKWGMFREKINEIIMQSAEENGLSSMEDKRLGGWFIIPKKASDAAEGAIATITSEAFAEKVLKYLWDDAFKFDRKSHFGDVKTLEKLIEKFKIEGFKVFSDEQMSGLSQNGSSSTQTGTSES